jgi:hypothetical protein
MAMERWCRVTMVGAEGEPIADGVLEGPSTPDLGAVEDLARLALLAKRLDAHLELLEVAPELAELLELAGLRVEMERQPERGE